MRLSYIEPRTKSIFSPEMQLLVSFFTITLLMLFLTYGFLLFKDYQFTKDTHDAITKRENLDKNIANMKEQISFIEKEILLNEKVTTKNVILKDSIANLFDLVPQRITLSKATLLHNGLILYGITPNKDTYNFMLQAPLKSIFHKTYSSFYPQDNGWFKFVSTNYIDKEDGELEDAD